MTAVAPLGAAAVSGAVEFDGAYYFFAAAPGDAEAGLWKTDGATAGGTTLVTTVPRAGLTHEGTPPEPTNGPRYLVAGDDALYRACSASASAGRGSGVPGRRACG